MRGFIDLHSHWVAGIDDGAKTVGDSVALLDALHRAGFDTVVATPHMRPGMFDNTDAMLRRAFEATLAALPEGPRPALHLSSEHFFDDVVYQRILGGQALPYPGGHAVLIEFPNHALPLQVERRFADLVRRGLRPVLAHPERYDPVSRDPACLEGLLDVGTLMLLDVAALSGKYGRSPRKTAERMLDEGYYYAACSDAHRASDVDDVRRGIDALAARLGDEEAQFMLAEGPRNVLAGTFVD